MKIKPYFGVIAALGVGGAAAAYCFRQSLFSLRNARIGTFSTVPSIPLSSPLPLLGLLPP